MEKKNPSIPLTYGGILLTSTYSHLFAGEFLEIPELQ
jgi:hypothetical protein